MKPCRSWKAVSEKSNVNKLQYLTRCYRWLNLFHTATGSIITTLIKYCHVLLIFTPIIIHEEFFAFFSVGKLRPLAQWHGSFKLGCWCDSRSLLSISGIALKGLIYSLESFMDDSNQVVGVRVPLTFTNLRSPLWACGTLCLRFGSEWCVSAWPSQVVFNGEVKKMFLLTDVIMVKWRHEMIS